MGLFSLFKSPTVHKVDELKFDNDFESLFLSNYYFPRVPLIINKQQKPRSSCSLSFLTVVW